MELSSIADAYEAFAQSNGLDLNDLPKFDTDTNGFIENCRRYPFEEFESVFEDAYEQFQNRLAVYIREHREEVLA